MPVGNEKEEVTNILDWLNILKSEERREVRRAIETHREYVCEFVRERERAKEGVDGGGELHYLEDDMSVLVF